MLENMIYEKQMNDTGKEKAWDDYLAVFNSLQDYHKEGGIFSVV